MHLEPVSADDLPLFEAIYCDPAMMAHLGGPFPKERVPRILRDAVSSAERGEAWLFKVIPDGEADQAAGSVALWESTWRGEPINEIGWTILPPFQGRGLASAAVQLILEKARAERRFPVIHAFPAVANAPSNALCRKHAFSLLGECEVDYAGRTLHCNHWRLDLRAGDPSW